MTGCASLARSPKKTRLPACEGRVQLGEEQASEEARQHVHRQKEAFPAGDPALAVERRAAAGRHAMDMGMMLQVWPQVCSTAVMPSSAPRCLGSAATVESVSAAVRIRMA